MVISLNTKKLELLVQGCNHKRQMERDIEISTSTKATLHTDGSGHWSKKVAAIQISKMSIRYYIDLEIEEEDKNEIPHRGGSLSILFNTKDWKVWRDGLIYTDQLWIKELQQHLLQYGFSQEAAEGVRYSEQGLQGNKTVNLDVEYQFIREFTDFCKLPQAK